MPRSMRKKRKWTILPFIFIASLILVLLYFLTLHKPFPPAEPLKAIPVNASVIVQVNNFRALFEKFSPNNALWNELSNISGFGRIDSQIRFLDSLYKHVPDARQILQNTPSFISAHFTGRDRISLMHVFQLPPRYPDRKIVDLISRLVVDAGTVNIRKYEGITIRDIVFLNEKHVRNFSFTVYNDILMISFSSLLLEDAIRQLSAQESVLLLEGFENIYATAGKNVDANVFINFQHFPRSLSVLVKPDFKAEVRSVKSMGNWAEMDVNWSFEQLMMNGFLTPPDSVPSIAGLFLNQAPQRPTADEILPGSTASFLTICFSDINRYVEDYQNFLQNQGLLTGYQNTIASLDNTYGTSLLRGFTEIMDNEISLAFDTPGKEEIPGQEYILLRIKSATQTKDYMNSIIARIADVESKPISAYTTLYRLDNEMSFNIVHLPIRKLTSKLFGSIFSTLDEHYFTVIGNYLVFSSSVESVKYLIHCMVLNKTLQHDAAYQEFKNSLSPRSNLLAYCNLNKGQSIFSPYLTDEINRQWTRFQPVFQKVQILGWQLFSNNRMLYTNFLIKFLSAYNSELQTVWESKLDTLVDFKPVFVMNHQTRQNEVFVQDMKNNVYLINQVGRILWKLQLPEPINSEIFQVDYFRNGKLQLLFSTRSSLYLIDRNGNFVERYPVKLRSPATCGVVVFDYNKNHDYRLFIACEDRHVYAYGKNGNLIQGWGFDRTESTVTQPVEYFRIGDKDFIVFGDRFKTYILDRKGNTRVNVEAYFPKSARNSYMLDIPRDGSGPSIVTTDTAGMVYFIGFNGKSRTLEPGGTFTNQHFFDYNDLTGDGRPEYIYLEGNTLTVYDNNLSRIFTRDFDSPLMSRPIFYQFSTSDRKLGIVSRAENLIYLINQTGDLYAGFPLQGNTPFSIGNFGDTLSRFNLVVGSRDNFLYNYRVK